MFTSLSLISISHRIKRLIMSVFDFDGEAFVYCQCTLTPRGPLSEDGPIFFVRFMLFCGFVMLLSFQSVVGAARILAVLLLMEENPPIAGSCFAVHGSTWLLIYCNRLFI